MKFKSIKKQFQLVAVSLMFVGGGNVLNAQNTFPANGNVGIGIIQPQYLLDVNGTGRFRTVLSNNGSFGTYYYQTSFNTAKLNVLDNPGNGQLSLFKVGVKIGDNNFLDVFKVKNDGTVVINKLFKNHHLIINNGGTEVFKVDENGKAIINAVFKSDNLVIKEENSGSEVFIVNQYGKLTIKAKGHDHHFRVIHENGTELHKILKDGTVLIRTQNHFPPLIVRNTNNHNVLSVSDGGNLVLNSFGGHSIIVNNASSQKILQLEDSGLLRAREIKVDEANWPDYVFNKNYQLLDLEQVAQYILKHKHLPGVPSAKIISSEGLSIGKMQTILMQKIEELTLYTIEQNTQIKNLQTENKQLKAELKQMNERLNKIEAMLNQK